MCRFLTVRGPAPAVRLFLQGPALEEFQRRSQRHTAGWGVAWYRNGHLYRERAPVWIRGDVSFLPRLRTLEAERVILHVRRATRGGVSVENTHPFVEGHRVFAHNGTLGREATEAIRELLAPQVEGETDSELFFRLLSWEIERAGPVVEGVRRAIAFVLERSPRSRLNFVFADEKGLYVFRRGHNLYHFLVATEAGMVEGASSDLLVPGSGALGRDWMLSLGERPEQTRLSRIVFPAGHLHGAWESASADSPYSHSANAQ